MVFLASWQATGGHSWPEIGAGHSMRAQLAQFTSSRIWMGALFGACARLSTSFDIYSQTVNFSVMAADE